MTRLSLTLAGLLRSPDKPLTPLNYAAFIGRLTVFYGGVGALGGVLSLLAFTAYALASAPPRSPDPPHAYGCAVILPSPAGQDDIPDVLQTRTLYPYSECDDSAPVSFGASVRDNAAGRAR